MPKFASLENNNSILNNYQKISQKMPPLFRDIYNFINIVSLPFHLILSVARFGIAGEITKLFVEKLFASNPQPITNPEKNLEPKQKKDNKKIRSYMTHLRYLLLKYYPQILQIVLTKESPYYKLVTYFLEHFTTRPGLRGLIYWSQIEDVPSFKKLLSLALDNEIVYLNNIIDLDEANFALWTSGARYIE